MSTPSPPPEWRGGRDGPINFILIFFFIQLHKMVLNDHFLYRMNILARILAMLNSRTLRPLITLMQYFLGSLDDLQLDARDFPPQAEVTGSY